MVTTLRSFPLLGLGHALFKKYTSAHYTTYRPDTPPTHKTQLRFLEHFRLCPASVYSVIKLHVVPPVHRGKGKSRATMSPGSHNNTAAERRLPPAAYSPRSAPNNARHHLSHLAIHHPSTPTSPFVPFSCPSPTNPPFPYDELLSSHSSFFSYEPPSNSVPSPGCATNCVCLSVYQHIQTRNAWASTP